jgi:hypothetical protein
MQHKGIKETVLLRKSQRIDGGAPISYEASQYVGFKNGQNL